jgi:phage-related minor tail protein
MAKARGVVIPIVADVRGLVKGIGNTEQRLNRLGRNVGKVGANLTKSVTLPIVGAGIAAVAAWDKVDTALDDVAARTGATGKELGSLQDSFKRVAGNATQNMDDVAIVVGELNTRLGLTGAPLEEVSTQMLTLARVAGTEVESTVTSVTRAMNDMGISAAGSGGFMDVLLTASQKTGIGVDELAQKMVKFGSPMRQLGFSVEETAALLGGFEKAGVNTDLVMGSLRIALGKLAKAGKKDLPSALRETIKSIENAKTGGEAAALAMEVFGARAGADMAAAIREGRLNIDDLVESLENADGALVATAAEMEGPQEQIARLKNQAMLAGAAFAEIFIPVLSKIIPVLQGITERFQNLSPQQKNYVTIALATAAAIGPLLVIIGKAITIFSTLRSVIIAVRAAQIGLNLAMIANPIGLIVIAIAALVAGLIIAYKRSETFRNIVDQIAAVARNVLGQAIAFVRQKIEEWGPAISSAYAKAQPILRVIGKIVQTYVTVYIRAVSTYIKVWATVIKTAYEVMRPIIIKIGGAIRDYIVAYVTAIRTGIDLAVDAFNILRDTILGVVDRVSGPLDKAAKLIDRVARSGDRQGGRRWFFEFSKDAKENIADAVARATQNARRNLQSLGSSLSGMVQTAIGQRSPEAVEARRIRAQQEETRKRRERARLDEAIANAQTAEERQQAQQDLDDWLLEEEAKRLEETVQKNQESAQQQIDDLIAEFNRGGMSAEVFQQRLSGLLGPDFGMELGMAFRDGFQLALQELIAQVQELVGAAGGITPSGGVSPAAAGAEASTAEREKAFEEAQAKYKRLQDLRKKRDKQAAIAENNKKTAKERENAESLRKQLQNQINNLKKTLPGRGTREPRRSDFGLAKGGILKKTVFAAGEMGPEAVIPLGTRGGANILRDALLGTGPGARAQQQGGGTYNITINAGLGTNPDELSRVIVESIRRFEKRNGRVFSGPLLSQTVNTANKTDPNTGQTGTFTTIRAARLG